MTRIMRPAICAVVVIAALAAPAARADDDVYLQTNLVSDTMKEGANPADPILINPWGLTFAPGSPFWIADNGTGCSTLYDGNGVKNTGLQVKIPLPAGGGTTTACQPIDPASPPNPTPAAPTGAIWNDTQGFKISSAAMGPDPNGTAATFIFATEDGTIPAWTGTLNPRNMAVLAVDNSKANAVYKALALGTSFDTPCFEAGKTSGICIYATNFRLGRIDVFDSNFAPVALPAGAFTDPSVPANYAPFGIRNVDGDLFVTFAQQNAAKHDDVAGPGHGFVDVFDTAGHLLHRFASRGVLNSPWAIARAPLGFGRFGGEILIGNFGDGRINVFSRRGEFIDRIEGPGGRPIVIDGLWSLVFGGALNSDPDALYFTAGPNGESGGLFGMITPAHQH